ncbi:MAG: hypothetical protein Tsb009_02810 [Planctomycetaceae bacterium]
MAETVITIAFLLISFIAWIVNLVNEKKREVQRRIPPRQGPRPRKADGQFQNEIDQFLSQVRGTKQQQEDPLVEVVPEEELRERNRSTQSNRPITSLQQKNWKENELGSELRSHVNQYMETTIDDEEELEFIPDDEDSLVDHNSATTEPYQMPLKWDVEARSRVVEMLRNPRNVRNAIMISEVLSPCHTLKASRGKS